MTAPSRLLLQPPPNTPSNGPSASAKLSRPNGSTSAAKASPITMTPPATSPAPSAPAKTSTSPTSPAAKSSIAPTPANGSSTPSAPPSPPPTPSISNHATQQQRVEWSS